MALVRASRNCFTAFNAALEAVERNDVNGVAIILRSVQSDTEILQREASILHKLLINVEQENEAQVEDLTEEINILYQKEQQWKQEENNLRVKISGLKANREQHQECRNAAQRRYEEARAEQREAEKKHEEFQSYAWVPVYGLILGVRELIEKNEDRARQAERDKNRHGGEMENADREIRSTNAAINEVHQEIEKIQKKMNKLKQDREKVHKELGEYKAMTTVTLEVLSFSEVLISLTGEASLKTDYLQRIVALAAKRKINIKQSRGMNTAVNSFEDSWMNIIDMMNSNRIALLNDSRLVSIS